jgi:hypothetical protein
MNEEQIFQDAIQITDPTLRQQFIESECGDSSQLKSSVQRLVDLHLGESRFVTQRPHLGQGG